jgi:hypothetical protein
VTETGPPEEPGPPDRVTIAPGVAVPEITGVTGPRLLLAGVRIATVGSGTVVKLIGCEVLPPGPVAVTVRALVPVGRTAIGPQAKVPDWLAVVVQTVCPAGLVMAIALPGVAVPEIMGAAAVETLTGAVTLRVGGATAVIVTASGWLVPLTLLVTAVMTFMPGCSPTVQEKLPAKSATFTHSTWLLFPVTLTVLPAVAVPLISVAKATVLPVGGLRICTVGGAKATKVGVTAVVLPPALVAVTVSVLGPAGTVTAQAKVPPAVAVVEQSVTGPGPVMTTTLPGVAVPDTVGLVLVGFGIGARVSTGGATAVKLLTAGLLLPPALPAVAVMLTGPGVSKTVPAGTVQVPVGEVVTTTGPLPGALTVTLLFGVAVPEMTGDSVVCEPVAGALIATVGAGTVVKEIGTEVEPPGPVAVTVRLLVPVGRPLMGPQANVPPVVAVVLHTI